MKIDYHIHTKDSIDAKCTVDECCFHAVVNGLSEICFTNHQEWDSVTDKSYDYALSDRSWKKHIMAIETARKKYPDLTIKLGVELGYFAELEEELRQFTQKYPFDYVLGSVHRVNGINFGIRELFETSDKEKAFLWKAYFRAIAKASKSKIFDCIGHFDIPKRRLGQCDISYYEKEVDDAILQLVANDTGIEINMSGFYLETKEQFPCDLLFRKIVDAKIKYYTFGSDAHDAIHVGRGFEQASAILHSAGVDLYSFSGRHPKKFC